MALDIDYVVYESAMGAEPSAQWQQATNQLFIDWKKALRINRLYERFDVIYLFVAETEQVALLNAVKRGYDATNNGMTFTRRVGFQGDGAADYINTNYDPSTDGIQYTDNNALFGVHSWTDVVAADAIDIGNSNVASHIYLICKSSSGFAFFAINDDFHLFSVANGAGLFLANRDGSTKRLYRNGVSAFSTTSTVVSVDSGNMYIGRGTTTYSTRQFGAAVIGSSMTADEHAAFYAAWARYLDAISTVEPPTSSPSPPVVGTNAVVQIFDRTGVPIGEILPLIDFVSWRRNEVGQAVFSLAKTDPKANDVFLRPQNRVLITFDNGLPPWGGIMQPEFSIGHSTITARALTAESVLSKRMTGRGRYFTQQTVGTIATALITEAAAINPLGVELGQVWAGGTLHSPSYHYKDLFVIFRDSLFKRLTSGDFYVEPVIKSDGRLIFRINIVERRGRNLTGVALHQGLNVVEPTTISWHGPLVNRWVIIGDGDGWGSDRPVAVADDLESQYRFGLLEASEIHQGVIYPETLQATADNLLSVSAWPRVILSITTTDQPPASFEQYDIGDTLPVELPDYGIGSAFVGTATIQSRAFYPKDGRLNLVLEATEGA